MASVSDEPLASIRQAAALLANSRNVVILSGAGSSTPSGIPDFRSPGSGLWARYSPMEVASLTTFRHHPEVFFNWMRPFASHILKAKPNPAHLAITDLQKAGYIHTIITQNIDTLHQRAGSTNVLEVHGSLGSLTCISCYTQYNQEGFIGPYIVEGVNPVCPECNHYLKPDVVLFEEQLPYKTWLKAKKACDECDLLIVSGSSLIVMPVAGLPIRALENGAKLIVVNLTPTYIDERAAVTLRGDVADLIPAIASQVLNG